MGERFEELNALVDASATFTVIPPSPLDRLGVEPEERMTFEESLAILRWARLA